MTERPEDVDPDRPLIERAQKELPYGTAAYDELVRRHSATVFGRAYGILRSSADAEEAAQDVFMAVFRNLARFRFERPFAHWLSTVTMNACRMILRRRASDQRRRNAFEREQALEPPAAVPSNGTMRQLVIELLDALDPTTRMAMLMRYVEGYTNREIGEQLDLSESAVKMRVSRGSRRLRELYEARTTARPGDGESDDGDA